MANQRQLASGDTSVWTEKYGDKSDGVGSIDTRTFAEANETFTGTSDATTGTAGGTSIANNDLVIIHQTRGTNANTDPNWELNKVTSGGGTTDLTFKYTLTRTYTSGAQILKLKQYSSLTVNSGQTWTCPAWDGSKGGVLAYLCNGHSSIEGPIVFTSKGFRGGTTYTAGSGNTGEGTVGAVTTGNAANGNGGGGGSEAGEGGGGGGGGGNAAAGTTGSSGQTTPGTGGTASGNAGLTIITLGGGGGVGGSEGSSANDGGVGGAGGGIGIIISKTFTATAAMTLGAAAGGAGTNTGDGSGGGGGGAGGSLLVKTQVAILGTALITAPAGAGGPNLKAPAGAGGPGAVGRVHLDYLTSYTGTSTPDFTYTQDTTLRDDSGGFFNLNFK